jgi:Na+/H+ antiporter NhaD/arsenite permease-like protein
MPTLPFDLPFEFVLFGLTLAGVALLHAHVLRVALLGLAAIVLYKLFVTGFDGVAGLPGLLHHLAVEWVILANLFGLLVGFALLARHFEASGLPAVLPALLPDSWWGGFALLALIFVISSFLDNIAAAMIGGTIAAAVFRGRVHIGYLAAIVAASNAGGSGSVLGDTTTTMMWIDGVSPLDVLHAYVAAVVALLVFGVPTSLVQQRYSPIRRDAPHGARVDGARVGVVFAVLIAAATTNIAMNLAFPQAAARFPFLGAAVWAALLASAPLRKPDWSLVPGAMGGSVFLLALVLCASMMPVERLPQASWQTAFGLGFISAVFDNIPLTKLALDAGGYDWGALAYSVGFGGSMIWFGSSAGVAIASRFPEARSVGLWLRHGWSIVVAYVVGYFALLAILGWQPHAPHRM